MDLTTAETFLGLFGYDVCTLAYLNHKSDGSSKVRSFGVKKDQIPKALRVLGNENKKGAEIYFMVHEGTGRLNEKKTAAHSSENVVALTSLFLDAELPNDRDPLPDIREFCQSTGLVPHAVIRTSKNRYHVYWLLERVEKTQKNVLQWKRVQAYLHKTLSIDKTMTDLPQILRIPGFRNVKKECTVKPIKVDPSLPPYRLEDVYDLLSKSCPDFDTTPIRESLPPVTNGYHVPSGERHEELLRRARKLYGTDTFTDEDVRCYIDGFIQNHVDDNRDFLKNGKRREEVDRILESAKTYAEEEKIQTAQNAIIHHEKITKRGKSPFEMPTEFYYSAPGIVGELTRYIVDNARYPLPSHAFAMAAAFLGMVRSRSVRTEHGLPPVNYFLCLAPAGAGKTNVERPIKNLIKRLHLGKYVQDGIASAQGLFPFLEDTKGLGLVLHDEVGDLFNTIQKSKNSYEFKIGYMLTQLYTAYGSSVYPPWTRQTKKKPTPIENPLLSLIGFGHPHLLDTLFTKETVMAGLLPRFITFYVPERGKQNPSFRDTPRVPTHLEDHIREIVMDSGLALERTIEDDIAKLQTELSVTDDRKDRRAIEREISDLQSQISNPDHHNVKPQRIRFDTDSRALYENFGKEIDQLYDAETRTRSGIEGIFSRAQEQAGRLIATLADGIATPKVVQFAVDLVRSQVQAFHEKLRPALTQSTTRRAANKLHEKVIELIEKSDTHTVTKRRLQQSAYWCSAHEFREGYQHLVECGLIEESLARLPSGQRTVTIRLGNVTDPG